MAAILRDYVVKVRDKYQKTVSRIEWLKRQQEATVAVRDLEFTLIQFQLQLEQLLEAFQTLMTGIIPDNLLSFEKLHDTLKDVTLNLPEGCELAMGSQYNQMPWYYMHTDAVMTADFHSFKLAMLLPITVANVITSNYIKCLLSQREF
jgi:hypothetical protein